MEVIQKLQEKDRFKSRKGIEVEYIELAVTACLGKKKIRTLEWAEHLSRKFNQFYYHCPVCNAYHMTRSPSNQQQLIVKNKIS